VNAFVSYVGQCHRGLQIKSIVGRQGARGYPIYFAVCSRCSATCHVKHQRVGTDSCKQCALKAMRETLAQSPSLATKLAEVRAFDERVEEEYRNPAPVPVPVEPVASEPPKPPEKPREFSYTGSGDEIVEKYIDVYNISRETATKVVRHLMRADNVRHPSFEVVSELIAQYGGEHK